ncbi:MAG: histone deacetylase [Candidatus Aminicenantes bacterium]|nr:histone deacetylase [Candidatus Aminicenantes bacterium]
MKTGIVKDRRFLNHTMGEGHIENPGRLEAIYSALEEENVPPYVELPPRPAEEKEIAFIHSPEYISQVRSTAGKPSVQLDPDTSTSPLSYETALLAAGSLLETADTIMAGSGIQNAFALVRPPGHHAEKSRAMGFCIFNNIAIAAEHLIQKHGLKRILVVDWDIHHGNGTQNAFYHRKDVLYFSIHQFPFYPGTGLWGETGQGEGEGYTINVPLFPGKEDADYVFIFENMIYPLASEYRPEFILVSAGFDIHREDPLGGMEVSDRGFGAMTHILLNTAAEFSQNRLLLTLEGGYSLTGLQEGVLAVLEQLAGNGSKPEIEKDLSVGTARELSQVFEILSDYWPIP